MVFDFVCFTTLLAKIKSFISDSTGDNFVTTSISSLVSVFKSLSCSITPFNSDRNCFFGKSYEFFCKIILFFLDLRISSAFFEYPGARMISKNNLFISTALSSSIIALLISTPPKAETGSPASAPFQASRSFGRLAIPQALLCFKIANVVSSNSSIRLIAASRSPRLLYEMAFPCNCSNTSFSSP